MIELWMTYHVFLWKLFAALSLGGLVGVERQFRRRLAGVRTNALVAMGAASFTLFATVLPNPGVDSVARVAAQVVSGIGFLGAGVIMRDGLNVHGLTTAATLWCSASVGVLCGAGLVDLAVLSAGFILAVNLALRPLSIAIERHQHQKSPAPSSELIPEAHLFKIVCAQSSEKDVRKVLYSLVDLSQSEWISLSVLPSETIADGIVINAKINSKNPTDFQAKLFEVLGEIDGVADVSLSH